MLRFGTHGVTSPQDSVSQAAKLVKDHMTIFTNFEEVPEAVDRAGRASPHQMNEVPGASGTSRFRCAPYNYLKNANIQTISGLVQKTQAEMPRTKNFGR